MLKNKKAAANVPAFTTAQKNLSDSFRLSDKIKVLYRYFKLSRVYKGAVYTAINCFYTESLRQLYN